MAHTYTEGGRDMQIWKGRSESQGTILQYCRILYCTKNARTSACICLPTVSCMEVYRIAAPSAETTGQPRARASTRRLGSGEASLACHGLRVVDWGLLRVAELFKAVSFVGIWRRL